MSTWTIALLGTDTYYEPDANSEVLLSAMGYTDPMESVDWLKLEVIGAPENIEQLNGIGESGGGVAIHTRGQKKLIKLDLVDMVFPSEYYKQRAISELLRHAWIYFYQGTYVFDDYQHHADGNCMLVAAFKDVEDNYDDGVTRITINLRAIDPIG